MGRRATIHLRDIARIELAAEDASVTARLNDNDTVYISIWPLPGANEIDIGDSLYEKIAEINQTLPLGMSIDFAFDGTLYMRDALSEIFITLIETVVLVGLVVLLLMGSFRSAMVPLITKATLRDMRLEDGDESDPRHIYFSMKTSLASVAISTLGLALLDRIFSLGFDLPSEIVTSLLVAVFHTTSWQTLHG